jgi:hypothetical protein
MLEIAQSGRKTLSPREKVLIDAENGRAIRRMPFFELALQSLTKVAFHGRGADPFPPVQPAAVDAVEVLLIDGLRIGLAGPLARKDAGKLLAKVPATIAASPLGNLQFQDAGALSPVLVADPSQVLSFVS